MHDGSELRGKWPQVSLGSVGTWGSGGTPRRGVDGYYGGSIPWLKISDLNDGVVLDAEESITEAGLLNSSAKIVEPGALLVAMYGSIGKLGIAGARCATNQAIAFCEPNADVATTEYLFYLLLNLRPALIEAGKGGNQSNISQTVLKGLEIPLPPIDVQLELVGLLRSLVTQKSSASLHLKSARERIERFRKSVLAAACSGRLTSDWRQIHPPRPPATPKSPLLDGKKMPANRLHVVAEFQGNGFPEIPVTWTWVPLAAVADSVLGKMLDRLKNRGVPRPYLRNINVRWRSFDLTDVQEMRFEPGEEDRYGLRPGDVLVCEGGEPGRAAVWRDKDSDMRIQKALHRVRPQRELDPDWLVNVLQAHAYSGLLSDYFTGTGISHLTGASLAKVPIPLPPRAEQAEIVRRTERLLQLASRVENRIVVADRALHRASNAVLAQAFRGELGPNGSNGASELNGKRRRDKI